MAVLEQAIQEKELEQLVSLAETVSEKIEGFKKSFNEKDNQNTVFIQFAASFIIAMLLSLCLYYYFFEIGAIFKIRLEAIIFIGLMTALLLYIRFRYKNATHRNYKDVKIKIIQEQKVLSELLNMIHSYKELAYHDMSVVSRAVFEMRLSRIHFSAGDDFEMGNG